MKRLALYAAIIIALLSSGAAVPANADIVGIGDSVAAGAGLRAEEDPAGQDNLCDRSRYAYPRLVANRLERPSRNLACSGAKFDEGVYGQQEIADHELRAQLKRVFAPGHGRKLVVGTVGANDMRWHRFIRACYVTDCVNWLTNSAFWVYWADLVWEAHKFHREVRQQSPGKPPKVLLSGYYDPFGTQRCGDTRGISREEMRWIAARVVDINQALRSAARNYRFSSFVSVNQSFRGHRLCAGSPMIQGVQDNAPFHPKRAGQRAIAARVVNVHRG